MSSSQKPLQVIREGRKKQLFAQKGISFSFDEIEQWSSLKLKEHLFEAKVDGLRALYIDGKFYSNTARPLFNLEWLEKALRVRGSHMYVLDGEIFGSSWERTMSAVKSSVSRRNTKFINFYPFDWIPYKEFMTGKCTNKLTFRRNKLTHIVEGLIDKNIPGIARLPFWIPSRFEEVEAFFKETVAKPMYDGIMVKRLSSFYNYCEHNSWKKLKEEHTEDVKVIDFVPGKGKYTGMLGALKCRTSDKHIVNVSGFTDSQRDRIWRMKPVYKGKVVEVRYQKKTKDGNLYSPRFVRWRNDKE